MICVISQACNYWFEFLSFDEFKFMKSVERIRCSHGDDAPQGAWRPFGPRPTFLGHLINLFLLKLK